MRYKFAHGFCGLNGLTLIFYCSIIEYKNALLKTRHFLYLRRNRNIKFKKEICVNPFNPQNLWAKKNTTNLQKQNVVSFNLNNLENLSVNYTISVSTDDFIVELIIDKVRGSDSPEKKASKTS